MGGGRDLNGLRKDGSLVPIEVGLNPFVREGRRGAIATVIDISERKAAERRQKILVNEVHHRSRNLFAVIQALAMKTIPPQARDGFLGTIAALARTHELFLNVSTASLAKIIEQELAAVSGQVTVAGCNILLTTGAAQDFALIVHELATNSLKYGALSVSTGRVSIAGSADDRRFTFVWQETGGPVATAPAREGLGRAILHDLAKAFCTSVVADYSSGALRYELQVELTRITNVVELPVSRADAV